MKTLLLLIALISFGASAQSFKKDYSIKAVYTLIDSINNIVNGHNEYTLKVDSSDLNMNSHAVNFKVTFGFFYYVDKTKYKLEYNLVQFVFDKYDDVYNLRRISGDYASLFPMWKNLFNTSADVFKVEASGYDLCFADGKKKAHFHLMADKATWWITPR